MDLAEFDLPLLDEPKHPRLQQYEHEHTKRWSAAIGPADAFLFVTPEYDYFTSAALVNALQFLSVEWHYKAAGIVSYGGVSGGLRATQELRQLIGNLNGAMDVKDAAGLRELLKQYRDEYPEDAHVLADGYELIANCLERPGPETRNVAQRYYDEQLDSGLRRYIRRHCLEAISP